MKRRSAWAATVAVLFVAGCGEKDEPSTTGPVVPIEATTTSTTAPPNTPTTTTEPTPSAGGQTTGTGAATP